jgi:hypothetical protein
MSNHIESPVVWKLWSRVDLQSTETIFADRAIAEREATYIHDAHGHFASTRIAPITLHRQAEVGR